MDRTNGSFMTKRKCVKQWPRLTSFLSSLLCFILYRFVTHTECVQLPGSALLNSRVLFLRIQCCPSLLLFLLCPRFQGPLFSVPPPTPPFTFTHPFTFCPRTHCLCRSFAFFPFFFFSSLLLISWLSLQRVKINGSHFACGLWGMRLKQSAGSSFRGLSHFCYHRDRSPAESRPISAAVFSIYQTVSLLRKSSQF